jgi:tetratricopeptide (TPR) repeat protein
MLTKTTFSLERDVFENDEEYELRIKQIPPIEVGLAFLDISTENVSNESLLFNFSLEQSLPFGLEEPNVFYVSLKDVESLFNQETVLKYPLQVSLTVMEGTVMADTKTFSLKIRNVEISCQPVYLKKLFSECDEVFRDRIDNIPLLPIGNVKLKKELYNSELELFPGVLETRGWSDGAVVFEQEAFLKIDKVHARKLYMYGVEHPVYSKFKVVDSKVQLDNTKVIFDNHTYVFSNMDDSEFNTTAKLAIKGDIAAQYRLGEIYFHGELGKDADLNRAVSWFQKAYLQGSAKSLLQLIQMLVQRLVPIGLLKHLEDFLEEALKEETSEAQYLFAKTFADEEDYDRAASWYKRAALQGSKEAVNELLLLEKSKLIPKGKDNSSWIDLKNQETVKLVKDERKFTASVLSIKFDSAEVKLEVTDIIGELNVNDKLVFYKNGNAFGSKNYLVKRFLKLNLPNGKTTMKIFINGSKFEIDAKSDQVRVE